ELSASRFLNSFKSMIEGCQAKENQKSIKAISSFVIFCQSPKRTSIDLIHFLIPGQARRLKEKCNKMPIRNQL
ncbi:hypothetical protein Q5E55_019485, partial [Acinetobacter baumannii]